MNDIMQFLTEWGYVGIFISSFLAGSIVPFASEAVLLVAARSGLSPWWCIAWATAGNTLGGVTCYMIGRLGKVEWMERYLGISSVKLERAQRFMKGRGSLAALFVALPYIGDAIAVALGFMRSNFTVTTAAMAVGKFIRYVAVLYAAEGIISLF